jgi:V8-like Glu-specific endopeptidase
MYNTVPIVRTYQEQVVVVQVDMFDAQSGQPVWSASAETGARAPDGTGRCDSEAVEKAMSAYPPS